MPANLGQPGHFLLIQMHEGHTTEEFRLAQTCLLPTKLGNRLDGTLKSLKSLKKKLEVKYKEGQREALHCNLRVDDRSGTVEEQFDRKDNL